MISRAVCSLPRKSSQKAQAGSFAYQTFQNPQDSLRKMEWRGMFIASPIAIQSQRFLLHLSVVLVTIR